MKYSILLAIIGAVLIMIPVNISRPSFNGTDPGCTGSGCHTLQDGIVSASVNALQVQITLSGTTSAVAGELVDSSGTVVAVNNGTNSNPFTLTAPGPGTYTINAGYANPSRRWDSTIVNITVTNINDNKLNPTEFKLYNNYPNPFNPSTIIKYSVPNESFISIKIYDAIGNEVSSLVNENKPAGTYEVEFSAENLSSGVYFYSLESGSFRQTNKMILLK